MTEPPTNDPLFESLTGTIRNGTCIPIIGAGMSALDYPIWSGLVEKLREACDVRPEDIASNSNVAIAAAAKRKNAIAYYATLEQTFAQVLYPKSAFRYHMLACLNCPSYATLNFDPLLVDTLSIHKPRYLSVFPHLNPRYLNGQGELFYLHGRLPPNLSAMNTDLILTQEEFEKAYDPSGNMLYGFLLSAFQSNDICFLGCNPGEVNLAEILKICRAMCERVFGLSKSGRPRWYLLLDDQSPKPEQIEPTGIHVVRYPRGNAAFSGLDDVLKYWVGWRSPMIREPGVRRSGLAEEGPPR